jgi:transposase-like protein
MERPHGAGAAVAPALSRRLPALAGIVRARKFRDRVARLRRVYALAEAGLTIQAAARKAGVPSGVLYRWLAAVKRKGEAGLNFPLPSGRPPRQGRSVSSHSARE